MKKKIIAFILLLCIPLLSFADELTSPSITINTQLEIPKEVKIRSDARITMYVNEQITLYAELSGFDGISVTYQWQYDKRDGNGFVNIPNATNATYSFLATDETINCDYRVIVYY